MQDPLPTPVNPFLKFHPHMLTVELREDFMNILNRDNWEMDII